jgi:hypothetical protein
VQIRQTVQLKPDHPPPIVGQQPHPTDWLLFDCTIKPLPIGVEQPLVIVARLIAEWTDDGERRWRGRCDRDDCARVKKKGAA